MNITIELSQSQLNALALLEEKEHCTRAALIGEAISEYLRRHEVAEPDQTFGLWRDRDIRWARVSTKST